MSAIVISKQEKRSKISQENLYRERPASVRYGFLPNCLKNGRPTAPVSFLIGIDTLGGVKKSSSAARVKLP